MNNTYHHIRTQVGCYDGLAVVDKDGSISYPELFASVEKLTQKLLEAGVQPHARMGIELVNSIPSIVLSLAILNCQAVIVPISIHTNDEEFLAIIESIKLNYLFTRRKLGSIIENTALIGNFDGAEGYVFMGQGIEMLPLPDGRMPAFIRFSSGTTGTSKGVVLSHDAVLERTSACTKIRLSEGEKVLWVLDMAYHFVVTIVLFLRRRATIILVPSPVEMHLPRVLKQHSISLIYATPYHYRVLTQSPEIASDSLPSVKQAISTTMPLKSSTAKSFLQKFHIPINQAYGIIEVGLPCINDDIHAKRINSVGKLQDSYSIELRNPDNEGNGEIHFQGPGFFDAYFSPFMLKNSISRDGWFNTGDIGHLDEEGYLFIVGRKKEVINYLGMKIFPAEVESTLHSCPEIAECAVCAKSDPVLGEYPVAKIVLRENEEWSLTLENDIKRRCYEKLPAYKIPKEFLVVKKLPRTISGKIIRNSGGCK